MYQQTVTDIYLFLEHGIWKYLKIVSKSYGYICNSRIIITETIQGLFIKMNFSRFSFFGSGVFDTIPKNQQTQKLKLKKLYY